MTEPANGPALVTPARRVQAMSRKSFQTTSSLEKLKGYLRDVPVIHQRLTSVIEALSATALALKATTEQVQRLVAIWEEEQKHGNTAAAPGTAGIDGGSAKEPVLPGPDGQEPGRSGA